MQLQNGLLKSNSIRNMHEVVNENKLNKLLNGTILVHYSNFCFASCFKIKFNPNFSYLCDHNLNCVTYTLQHQGINV